MLTPWVTFANVPVTDANSIPILYVLPNANSIPILYVLPIATDPIPLLTLLGIAVLDTGWFVCQNVTWTSLEELRVHARGFPDLFRHRKIISFSNCDVGLPCRPSHFTMNLKVIMV
ncbi:hypothetical protein MHU86_1708 [Fragilaria crotonensis]|nr:hypothetical protein MHU86_1708 [Fragilaria crotonensis]